MSTQKHCPGCFQDKAWANVCPSCGYDETEPRPAVYLPHGTVLGGQFRIGRVLGRRGGFGITYLGWDVHLQQRVAIKEFLPRELATRNADHIDVVLHGPDERSRFDVGCEQFLREARIVASLDHPNIVRVRSFFRACGTAFLVMDYYEGISLGDYLSTIRSTLPALHAVRLLRPVLDGLQYVHGRGVVHRDVKPHNVYLASVGRPILLDFGSAQSGLAAVSPDSQSIVVSEGYAPLEQYRRHATQGPWTDVYGLAATLFRMVAGRAPPMALDRLGDDPLLREHWSSIPAPLQPVLEKALAVRPEHRFSTAREFRIALDSVRIALGNLPQASELPPPIAASRTPAPATQDRARVAVSAMPLK